MHLISRSVSYALQGNECVLYLQTTYLPSLQFPPELIQVSSNEHALCYYSISACEIAISVVVLHVE